MSDPVGQVGNLKSKLRSNAASAVSSEPLRFRSIPERHDTPAMQGVALRSIGRKSDGAGDRDRTDDIQLGKLTFYH